MAHNTIHSATNVHNQKTDTTVVNNIHGSGAVLCPVQFSQNPPANKENVDTMDKKLTDILWAVASNRDGEHKETRLTLVTRQATQVKSDEPINEVLTEKLYAEPA